MIVDVEREERYWYPDDGGIVWLAGFQPVAPDGRFLGRDRAGPPARAAPRPRQRARSERDRRPRRRRAGRLGAARGRGGDRGGDRRGRASLGGRPARAARLAARPAD